jgi:hypothetical protein
MAALVRKLKELVALKKGGDRAPSRPNRAKIQESLEKLEVLVIADITNITNGGCHLEISEKL